MNVKTAFLNDSHQEEIFMKQSEGFNIVPGKVPKLTKSLYGLEQASCS